MLTTTKVKL